MEFFNLIFILIFMIVWWVRNAHISHWVAQNGENSGQGGRFFIIITYILYIDRGALIIRPPEGKQNIWKFFCVKTENLTQVRFELTLFGLRVQCSDESAIFRSSLSPTTSRYWCVQDGIKKKKKFYSSGNWLSGILS